MLARTARALATVATPAARAPARGLATTCTYDWQDPLHYESLLTDEEVMIRVRAGQCRIAPPLGAVLSTTIASAAGAVLTFRCAVALCACVNACTCCRTLLGTMPRTRSCLASSKPTATKRFTAKS